MRPPLKEVREIQKQIIVQVLTLTTSGFGLVAALAWNEVIKTFIEDFIKPYLGGSSSVISLLIYAIVVTVIAVLITMQLAKIQQKLNEPVKS